MISKRVLFIVLTNVIAVIGWKIGHFFYKVGLGQYPNINFISGRVIFVFYYLVLLGIFVLFIDPIFIEVERNLRFFILFTTIYVGVFSVLGNFNLPIYFLFILNPVWFLGIFIFDMFHDVFQTTKLPSPISIFYCALLSKIKVLFGGYPIWIIPKDERESLQQTKMSNATYFSILDNLKYTPVSNAKKQIFKSQCYQILTNINNAIWKLHRTEQLQSIIDSDSTYNDAQLNEVTRLIEKITQEINKSLNVLSSSSTNLLKVEVSHGDLLFDQLLRNLNESNMRLKNISSVYQDAKGR